MENFSFSYIDVAIIIPLLWGAYKGLTKGFIIEAASLVALLIGIYGASIFSVLTKEILENTFNFHSEYMRLISFGITFIVIVFAVHLIAKAIDRLLNAVALGFFNRIAGLIFGIAKFAFFISILFAMFNKFDKNSEILTPEIKENSYLYEPISSLAPKIFPYLNFDTIKPKKSNEEEI